MACSGKTQWRNREATVLCLKMAQEHPWLHATIGQSFITGIDEGFAPKRDQG